MFISKAEKEEIQIKIRGLEARIRDLEIEATWTKNKVSGKRAVIFRTDDAPWGFKKDGNPRKRPGRPLQAMEISA
jgi:hypothetical protein